MAVNKDFYWYEEGGYLVVDLDRAPVIYLANGTFGALFIHGREKELTPEVARDIANKLLRLADEEPDDD